MRRSTGDQIFAIKTQIQSYYFAQMDKMIIIYNNLRYIVRNLPRIYVDDATTSLICSSVQQIWKF